MGKFFTKKVSLIVLSVIVALSGVIWAIVANLQPKFNSGITTIPSSINVSGNGTASVLVDDYLYFVGDSVTTSSIKYGDNEYYAQGKIPESGIYRVRISDSKPVVNYEYDNKYINDNGEKVEWKPGEEGYNQTVVAVSDWNEIGENNSKIQAVVPKIAGHDQSAMWVYGKYLIYTSPHNRYDNRGNLLTDYLDFFRVDLDGKNHTLIYTTDSADLTTDNFTVWANSLDNIYLLINETEKNELRKVNILNFQVTVLDSEISDVILPRVTQYNRNSVNVNENLDKVYGGVMSNVYYTKDRDENDVSMGNLLYSCSIISGETKLIASDGSESTGSTFKPLAVTALGAGNAQMVFLITVKNSSTTLRARLGIITNKSWNDYTYVEPSDTPWSLLDAEGSVREIQIYTNGFCSISNKLYHYGTNGITFNGVLEDLGVDVGQVLAVYGDTIYVKNDTTVYEVTLNKSPVLISIVPATTEDTEDTEGSDDTDSETTDNTITLPVAILSQPHGDQGKPMIFVQDANHIRLYDVVANQFSYLKFKQAS